MKFFDNLNKEFLSGLILFVLFFGGQLIYALYATDTFREWFDKESWCEDHIRRLEASLEVDRALLRELKIDLIKSLYSDYMSPTLSEDIHNLQIRITEDEAYLERLKEECKNYIKN